MRPGAIDEVCSGSGCTSATWEKCCGEARCLACHEEHCGVEHKHCADCGGDLGAEPWNDEVCGACRRERAECAAEDAADARRESRDVAYREALTDAGRGHLVRR